MADKYERYESLENWVAWDYLRGALNWSANKVAYELDLNEQRLTEWVSDRRTKMADLIRTNPEKVKKMRAEIEKQYPPESKEDVKTPKITIRKAVELLIEGKNLNEIAKIAKCPEMDFKAWWTQHRQLINVEYRKAIKA